VLASGTTQQRWKDFNVFAYERTGGQRLLVALNNDPNATHTIRVATGFGPNVHLKDYTGHGADAVTGDDGAVSIAVPPCVNGLGYVCYSRLGQDRPLSITGYAVTHDLEGAADLDILPAMNGSTVTAGRIWCAANTPVTVAASVDRSRWSAASKIEVALVSPAARRTAITLTASNADALHATASEEGFHMLQVTASGLPAGNLSAAYKLSVTYSAPQAFRL